MTDRFSLRGTIQLGMAGAALCISIAGAAFAQTPVATVATFADHYLYAGRFFDDLDRLEDAVLAAHPRGVRLEACGDGTARALGAAAHRFRNLYLDLRYSYIDDTTCASASAAPALPVSLRFGLRPYGINDEAVDRWWHTLSFP
jgi:hypothetical protein